MGNQNESGKFWRDLLDRRLSRRRLLVGGGIVALGAAVAWAVGCESGNDSQWPELTSEDYPYRISFPSDWLVFHLIEQGADGEEYDEFVGKGRVTINAIPADNLTLDEYKDQVVGRIKDSIRKSDNPNAAVYESSGPKIDNVDAWAIRHKYDFLDTKNEQFHYVFINNGLAWSIKFSAPQTDFQDLFPVFRQMVDSFKFVEQDQNLTF